MKENDSFIFYVTDLFPIPIEIFAPDGMSVFVNSAFLECFNISDSNMIIGKLNILEDSFLKNRLGLSEYLQAVFSGEVLSISNVKVPFEEINVRYESKNNKIEEADMYQDIISFPIHNSHKKIVYIVAVFLIKNVYHRQSAILKAKEYMETHWFEDFNINLIANTADLSRYHFTRLFKRYVGMTPYCYYQDIKIEKLKDALSNEALSIEDAFASCGTDFFGRFAKIFKDKVGMTPSQYRHVLLDKTVTEKQEEYGEACNSTTQRYLGENEDLFFQMIDLFPIPIQVFTPNGDITFINQAVLESWNISDPSQIVGKYNLMTDPFVNEHLGLREYVDRIFKGEVVQISDMRVPLDDFWIWYKTRSKEYNIESLYTDILNFPIFGKNRKIIYIVSVFFTTRFYRGKPDIARAKEYIENHILEDFDMEKIAKSVHLSKYHFAHMFKKYTGMTPHSYYQELKINRLKDALRDKNLSVGQAFDICGIKYHGNFVKAFKEKVGMTPSKFRQVNKF